jgi:putative ubiquitin-RnfH superfamily antitoxin RatB of RatAB toxin-antitoxin module
MKRCTVAFALPHRQWLWTVELPEHGTVADALARAREQAGGLDISWEGEDGDVGIFGEPCGHAAIPRDGDRIEIYRPLRSDPKESRRARAAAGKAAAGPASARPRTSPPKKSR